MFISVKDLELRTLDFREEFRPQVIDLGQDVFQETPLEAAGRAELVREHRGPRQSVEDIRLVGHLATRIGVSCARCLEPVRHDIGRDFDLLYRPLGVDAGREELSVTVAEAEIGYYTGDGLLLEDVLREQLLLAVPIKSVCREDCKGLCPQCGKNLNLEACSCVPVSDVRWDALKDIKDKLKS